MLRIAHNSTGDGQHGAIMVGAGLVVLAYKGSSDFFVGHIDRGSIINTHPLGKRKNGRVRLCMYRYISHGHDLNPQDPTPFFKTSV